MAHAYTPVTKSDNTYNTVTTPSKTYGGVTKSDNSFNPVTTPAKTYSGLTKSDNSFTAVSDITPTTGDVEDKFTWANIVSDYNTWLKLELRPRWADWIFATPFIDAYASLTTPDKTYAGITKSDNTYTPVTTPSKTHTSMTRSDRTYTPVTTPSYTYQSITK